MLTPEKLNHLIAPMFPGLMGVRVIDATPQRVRAELTVRPDLCTAGGILHGGAYMAFADALGAIGTVMKLAPGQTTTTTDSSTKFIRGAPVGTAVTGDSVALHRGRRTHVWQTEIRTADGKLCAVVTQTQLVMDSEAPEVLPAP